MASKSCFRPCLDLRSASRWLALLGVVIWLVGCGSAPPSPKEEPADLRIQLIASDNVNPDDKGRAAPIMVRVYELKSGAALQAADFFTLQEDERKAIGGDLLVVDEFILRPGDRKTIERRANPSTKVIGVVAGYRNLGKSIWRDVYPLRSPTKSTWLGWMFSGKKSEILTIRLDRQAVSIRVKRGDQWVYRAGSGG
jgi:type VI secretion system protein VasD